MLICLDLSWNNQWTPKLPAGGSNYFIKSECAYFPTVLFVKKEKQQQYVSRDLFAIP